MRIAPSWRRPAGPGPTIWEATDSTSSRGYLRSAARLAAPRSLIEHELGRHDVLDRHADRLEDRGAGGVDLLRSREDLAYLGVDRGLRKDEVAGLLLGRLARFDHHHVVHRLVIQLAPARHGRTDCVDVGAGLEPCALEN